MKAIPSTTGPAPASPPPKGAVLAVAESTVPPAPAPGAAPVGGPSLAGASPSRPLLERVARSKCEGGDWRDQTRRGARIGARAEAFSLTRRRQFSRPALYLTTHDTTHTHQASPRSAWATSAGAAPTPPPPPGKVPFGGAPGRRPRPRRRPCRRSCRRHSHPHLLHPLHLHPPSPFSTTARPRPAPHLRPGGVTPPRPWTASCMSSAGSARPSSTTSPRTTRRRARGGPCRPAEMVAVATVAGAARPARPPHLPSAAPAPSLARPPRRPDPPSLCMAAARGGPS